MVWLAVGVAAFVIGGGATAGVLLLKDDDGGGDRSSVAVESKQPNASESEQGPSPDPSTDDPDDGAGDLPEPPAASAPLTTDPATPADPDLPDAPDPTDPTDSVDDPADDVASAGLPEGYRTARDPQGFSLAVPADWEREVRGGQIDYRSADAPANTYLRVGIVRGTSQSAYQHFQELEGITSGRTRDYQRVELTANTFQGRPGARWEFRWVEKKSGRAMHAIDQAYVTADGTEYAIYYQGPAESFAVDREAFDTALESWSEGG